ncbi:hypothetical protein WJX73_004978 [Symbiochloris irregularis]|uniref:Exostosin GT47 domain-containing protein n=1 Tax=Symbiochloris irregularis TaxID=706552 RepID=A0AAW1NRP5_9CHLO
MHPRRSGAECLFWLGLLALSLLASAADVGPEDTGHAKQAVADLRVYIYPLPEHFQSLSTMPAWSVFNTNLYGAEKRIPEALQEAGYTAKNPSSADFMIVPAYFYAINGHKAMQLEGAQVSLQRQTTNIVLDYIRTQYPYWNASLGRDHIFTLTQDQGFCGFSQFGETHDEIANSVILSHWGLMVPETPCSMEERLATFDKCHERAQVAALEALGHRSPLNHPCFTPKKDVVVPTAAWDDLHFIPHQSKPAADDHVRDDDPNSRVKVVEAISAVKNHTLFFTGGVLEDQPEYSHGVRQIIYKLFKNESGFLLREKVKGIDPMGPEVMFQEMGRSHFCLAADGFGWGVRLKLAIKLACIPLVVHDNVQVPFQDILPYQDFAIRIPPHMIYRLPEILQTVLADHQRVADMRSRLACAQTFFSWDASTGQAVHALACSLLKKVHGADAVVPVLDWQQCTLQCLTPPR